MTETERNELVEKLATYRVFKTAIGLSDGPYREDLKNVTHDIETLGYEIIKKEHLKPFQDAFVLQEVRAGKTSPLTPDQV